MIDLNSVKARLGSIPVPIYDDRPSLKKLLTEDMPALIVEVSILRERLGPAGCNLLGELLEYRRSKAAREETVKLGEARGRHLPQRKGSGHQVTRASRPSNGGLFDPNLFGTLGG